VIIAKQHGVLLPQPVGMQKQAGLSLVEVMVAMGIGLVLMTGFIQFFIANKQSHEVLGGLNGMQENGRYAVRVITDSLHAADHWGGVAGGDVTGAPAVTGIGAICNAAWILNTSVGIQGFDGADDTPLAGCTATGYQIDTDVFVVRHAGGTYFPGLIANGSDTDIWVNTNVGMGASLSAGNAVNVVNVNGLYHYPYNISVYYIRPCSVMAAAACAASDDGGNPIPTLVRLSLQENQLVAQTLVSGVEQMQIEYGVDTDADTNANFYASAGAITTTAQWAQVVSARFSLVIRSDQRGKLIDTNNYTLAGGFVYTPAANAQRFARKVFTRLVQIRNRSRS